MAKFVVKSNINLDGVLHLPGEVIELSESQALEMPHAVQPLIVRPAPAKLKEGGTQ